LRSDGIVNKKAAGNTPPATFGVNGARFVA